MHSRVTVALVCLVGLLLSALLSPAAAGAAGPSAPAPELTISALRAAPTTFYPVVRDGYLDDTTVRFRVNHDGARVRASVTDVSTGEVVRDALVTSYALAGYGEEWVWSGRTDAGKPAGAGRYRVRITATNRAGATVSDTISVRIRHGRFMGTQSYDYAGVNTDRRQKSRSCYIDDYGSGSDLTLDCWGGRGARVDYLFRIPRDAHDLRWSVRGERNCCDRGRLSRTGVRVSPTKFRITVQVTGWRSFTIRRVTFRYAAKMLFREGYSRT